MPTVEKKNNNNKKLSVAYNFLFYKILFHLIAILLKIIIKKKHMTKTLIRVEVLYKFCNHISAITNMSIFLFLV